MNQNALLMRRFRIDLDNRANDVLKLRQRRTAGRDRGFDMLDHFPDMGVKVSFLEDRPADAATAARPVVRVPSSAIMQDGDTRYVWRVSDDRIERVAVRTGGERDGQVEVLSGVNAGDIVVAAPVEGLAEGVSVKAKTG